MKLLKTEKEIIQWLEKNNVSNYELKPSTHYSYIVSVKNSVNLENKSLEYIAVKFNHINGSFKCGFNSLKSLKGAPTIVIGDFQCQENQLASLQYCPTSIAGDFLCHKNNITNLAYFPKKVLGDICGTKMKV